MQSPYLLKITPEFYLEGGDAGVLLIHGYAASPYEVEFLGSYLNKLGFTVYAPLLAGHGSNYWELNDHSFQDFYITVLNAYLYLMKRCKRVYVGGLSLGGILSIKLALDQNSEIPGIFVMAPALYVKGKIKQWAISFGNTIMLDKFYRYTLRHPRKGREVWGYRKMSVKSWISVGYAAYKVEMDLKKLTTPIRIFHSRNDQTTDYKSSEVIFNKVSSEDKKLFLYEKSSHIMPRDYDKDDMFEKIAEFLLEREFQYTGKTFNLHNSNVVNLKTSQSF